jgi:type I restriction enzyme M protein
MTNEELKQLKDNLWNTADNLRANSGLKASEYATPILGLIFLKFIDSKYKKYETETLEIFDKEKGTRLERSISEIAIEKCGFYLPDNAKYNYLLTLPEKSNFAQEIKNAMEGIEEYASDLKDVLPKEEYFSLIDQVTNKSVLPALLKNFEDIPTDTESDIFGEVYEYFLGEFALKEGQGGGEFFTPSTVVKYMVEVLAPTEGKILDMNTMALIHSVANH